MSEKNWQPIETAPRDGTQFLAFGKGSYFNCWWHDNGYDEQYWMDEADSEPKPTHWMPLPPPPQAPGSVDTESQNAKASLIDAVPDLLDALKVCASLIRIQNGNLHQDVNAILDMAKAATDKAEGRS